MTHAPQIYDISPMLSERTAVFPQDVPFSRQPTLNFESGDGNFSPHPFERRYISVHTPTRQITTIRMV